MQQSAEVVRLLRDEAQPQPLPHTEDQQQHREERPSDHQAVPLHQIMTGAHLRSAVRHQAQSAILRQAITAVLRQATTGVLLQVTAEVRPPVSVVAEAAIAGAAAPAAEAVEDTAEAEVQADTEDKHTYI